MNSTQVSCVRSISMDEWLHNEILAMLEGGNDQLQDFFSRHGLCREASKSTNNGTINKDNVTLLRYKTKAALFYRQQLSLHVAKVEEAGEYRGRTVSRRRDNHRSLQERNSTVRWQRGMITMTLSFYRNAFWTEIIINDLLSYRWQWKVLPSTWRCENIIGPNR